MTYNLGRLFVAVLALACALGTAGNAAAQHSRLPRLLPQLRHRRETLRFWWATHGTQGYVCLPQGTGASWTVNAARPEATLFQSFFGLEVQIITHFLSPDTNPNRTLHPVPFGNATWQSSLDSSKVWAQRCNRTIAAGSDPSCPNEGSIACLLLQSIGSGAGTNGR